MLKTLEIRAFSFSAKATPYSDKLLRKIDLFRPIYLRLGFKLGLVFSSASIHCWFLSATSSKNLSQSTESWLIIRWMIGWTCIKAYTPPPIYWFKISCTTRMNSNTLILPVFRSSKNVQTMRKLSREMLSARLCKMLTNSCLERNPVLLISTAALSWMMLSLLLSILSQICFIIAKTCCMFVTPLDAYFPLLKDSSS